MPIIDFTIRDLILAGTILITVSLSYARLKSEIRHLEDTKAERREVMLLVEDLRRTLADIRTSLARLEEAVRSISRAKDDEKAA